MSKNTRIVYIIAIILLAPMLLIPALIDKPTIEIEYSTIEDIIEEHSEMPILEIETESDAEILEKVANLVAENLENKNYDIYFKGSSIICIDVCQEGLADKVSNIILTGDYSIWNKISDTTCEIVNNTKALTKAIGYDYTICWTWCDNFNGEKTPFLVCEDGVIVFDMVKAILTKTK